MNGDLVSAAIDARARAPEGLQRMLGISAGAHVLLLAVVVFVPGWLGDFRRPPDNIMVISLGGAPGPATGGMTSIGGRPVQQAAPKPELPRPEPVRPPAAKPPEMVEPTARAKPAPRAPVKQAPREATSRTPTSGTQVRAGESKVDTKSSSSETGLSTGGGGGDGGQITGDFCDPAYLGQMVGLIQRNWNSNQRAPGVPVIRYVIQRDGQLTDITVRQSSGNGLLDMLAQRSVQLTKAIPPLPACYPHPTFAVNLSFEYIR
jgi:TonB family protein